MFGKGVALWRSFAFHVLLDMFPESQTEKATVTPSLPWPGRGRCSGGSWKDRNQPCEEQGKGILAGGVPELTA